MTPRKRDAQATRAKLLETASQVFSERGFDGARIDEIAERSGVNKRMIYVYFVDKEGLYREVLASHYQHIATAGQSLLAGEMDPRARAAAIMRRYLQFLAQNPNLVRLIAWDALHDSHRAAPVLTELASSGLAALQDVLRAGMAQGVFRPDLDPHKVVMSIGALCLGYFIQRPLVEAVWKQDLSRPEALEDVQDHFLRLVFDGFCVPQPPSR